jgi:23S rRNA pseudouridine1911/1915/1917 synthase
MSGIVEIVYKDKNVIIVKKPVGMPSQSDPSGDIDAMSAASEELKKCGEEPSLWLIHRLDRTVGGLIAFARNKRCAGELSSIVASGNMEKKYFAVCHGEATCGEYRDYLYKDNVTSKAYVVKSERKGAKEAVLFADIVDSTDSMSLASVTLKTGRFHQIRAQFSSRKNPLVGDKKYGSRNTPARFPALFSYSLSFELFGKTVSAKTLPPFDEYPWNIFDKNKYITLKENVNEN